MINTPGARFDRSSCWSAVRCDSTMLLLHRLTQLHLSTPKLQYIYRYDASLQVKVCVCSPLIPVGSAEFTLITPGIRSHYFTLITLWIQRIFNHPHSTNHHSTWYPLLLGGQRRCAFKAFSRLLHNAGAVGIEPQNPRPRPRVQSLNHSVSLSLSLSLSLSHTHTHVTHA